MNCKNKSFMTKRKAFTLIELLIVIAIIGILFIVLVSKVDFATDKAKASGVQTDFRSFQVAIESVAKEHAGLATFGWDTGDTNGNRIRDSYDKGDTNKNGIQDDGEIFVGSKVYGETWTNVYTLTNPADANDKSAIAALEAAINKNLDPKLHITIHDDLTITMANGAQDPWNTEYHGYYITNATTDGKDRGAIVMYSNGANQEWGSAHSIANGVVTVNVPGNNVYGKDDYSIISVYTYVNGYGEVKTTTTGFSNNQGGGQAGTDGTFTPGGDGGSGETSDDGSIQMIQGDGLVYTGSEEMKFISNAEFSDFEMVKINGVELNASNYTKSEGSTIIVLNQSYLSTLENATYTIEIISSTGTASCNFTVNKPVLTLNEYGFYYDVMYLGVDQYGVVEGVIFYDNGTCMNFYNTNSESTSLYKSWYEGPEWTIDVTTKTITDSYGAWVYQVSEDGLTITGNEYYFDPVVMTANFEIKAGSVRYNTEYICGGDYCNEVVIFYENGDILHGNTLLTQGHFGESSYWFDDEGYEMYEIIISYDGYECQCRWNE